MKVGIYCVGDDIDKHLELGAVACRAIKRVMPGVEVHHFTDMTSKAIEGVNCVDRLPRDCPMAVFRMRHHQVEGEWLFIDTDVLVTQDVSDVFAEPFDIAISSRVGNDGTGSMEWGEMPHNMGVVFSRSPKFWAAAESELLKFSPESQMWMGDQLAVCRLIKTGIFNALILPGEVYNCIPGGVADINNAAIVHYKGGRKGMMSYDASLRSGSPFALLYDMSNRPASFDFVTCLATAVTQGANHVRFVLGNWKQKNYTVAQAEERWRSIVEPACSLFGIDYSIGEREGAEVSHFFHKALEVYRQHGRIAKITACPEVPKGDYYTITLRKSRTPVRDSNEPEWRKFAKRLDGKVLFLRDYEEQPLGLRDRMRLYAGARMNFMVINGPLTLCIHSEAPYLCMRTIGGHDSGSTSPEFMASLGITPGFQFPWANENQRLSYLDDTAENIMHEYLLMSELRMRAAA